MDAAEWTEVRRLFEQALELSGESRRRFVEEHVRGRAGLRAELERLLAHADDGPDSLAAPTPEAFAGGLDAWRPGPGECVGAYRVERLLGQGGMGSVYEARQERPTRSVALKVMHVGLATIQSRRRFEAEAEILGRLRHPGIAQIHEAGVHRTPSGGEVPFFAMELIEGARDLVGHVRERELDLRARVELFASVCDAVHHAHQKGVIHRDLKPGNILVDAGGQVKVIDYGVARVTGVTLSQTQVTQAGFVLGTLQYMSPEQLSAGTEEVDTRSDIYSLGVLLYEVVSGRVPYQVEGRSIAEVVVEICERDPPPPSSRAGGLSRELDWIVLEALAKEPERRYASAAEFGDDLRRLLRAEPLVAGPPTRRYRVAKFVARNRALVAIGVLLLASLVVGITATSLAMFDAQEARAAEAEQTGRAVRALERQTAVIDTLGGIVSGMLPNEDGREVTLFELVERRRSALEEELAGDPELRAALLVFFTEAYYGLGLLDEAAELAESALRANAAAAVPDPALADRVRHLLVGLRLIQMRPDEAQELIDQADREAQEQEQGRTVSAEDQLYDLRSRAMMLGGRGDYRGAADLYLELVERAELELDSDDPLTPTAMGELAELLELSGSHEEALGWAREGYERVLRELCDDTVWTATLAMRLGLVLSNEGELEQARELQRSAVDLFEQIFGRSHSNTLQAIEGLVRTLSRLGRTEEAEPLARDAIEACVRDHGAAGIQNEVRLRHALAGVLGKRGDTEAQVLELTTGLERLDSIGQGGSPIAAELRAWLERLEQ